MSSPRSIHATSVAAFVIFVAGISLDQVATAQSSVKQQPNVSPEAKIEKTNLSAPLFIENVGQFDSKVRFQVKIGSQTVWLTSEGIVFDATRPAHAERGVATALKPSDSASRWEPLPLSAFDRAKPDSRSLDRLVFSEDFVGASCCSKVEGKEPQPGVYNYFQSGNPKEWRTNVRGYAEVVYRDVWPGIDLRIYGDGSDLEQEFIVRPGGDLNRVQIAYRGIDGLSLSQDGSLEINTPFGELTETSPRIYQEIAAQRVAVDGRFKLLSETSYTFEVSSHSAEHALVIDPTLLYSTFLGGSAGNNVYSANNEVATGIGIDGAGEAVVAGYTASTDFPTTPGAFQVSPSSGSFVTKLNATGSALVYSTYFGYSDSIQAIAVDSIGNAYVTGYTFDTYYGHIFPTTPNAYWPTNSNQRCSSTDFFVTELNPAGNGLVYSSCFNANPGGGYYPRSIAVDTKGRVFVTGYTGSGLPTTANAYQPSFPGGSSAFVSVFDTTISGPSSLVYSTYFGLPSNGSVYGVSGNAIAVDSFGSAYITGFAGPGMPVTPGAFQSSASGAGPCNPYGGAQVTCPDAFVAKFNPSAVGTQSLIYSTYLGGPGPTNLGTRGNGIAVDGAGNAYVTGNTGSANFPVTSGAFQTNASASPLFVAKLNAGGSKLVYSTYLSGNIYANNNSANGIAVDSLGNAYVAGGFRAQAQSTFPITPDAFQSSFTKISGDFSEAFLSKLDPNGSALIYSSYLGGSGDDVATAIAIDQTGDAYVAGHTSSFNFPIGASAFQPSMHGTGDAFVTKFPLGTSQSLSISSLVPTSGGNAGAVSSEIFGTGFHAGATAQLNCPSPIMGTNLTVGSGGRVINATYNLVGVPPGTCDIVVTNLGGASVTLAGAFTVQQGGAPNIQIYLTGLERRKVPPEVALGPADALVAVTISNTGSVDSSGILVSLPVNSPFAPTSATPTSLDDASTLQTTSEVQWLLPVPAGTSQIVMATSSSPTQSTSPVNVQATVDQNMQFYATCVAQKAANVSPTCPLLGDKFQTVCEQAFAFACLEGSNLNDCNNALSACYRLLNMCTPKGEDIIKKQCDCTQNGSQSALAAGFSSQLQPSSANGCGSTTTTLPIVIPADPNDLVGPPGVGGQRWTAGAQGQTYVISFSNIPTAPVPAQQVIVTLPLGSNVNLSSLRLLGVTIPNGANNVQASVPTGSFNPSIGVNEFITNVDLRPTQSLLVNVDAFLNPATQNLTWTLTSIDPATGQPPVNPLVGFLPAGAEANVSYSVMPKPGLATGTQIAEQASIVFVGNSPMSTATWITTIDNASPLSHVSALSSASTCPAFRVVWSGSDLGSGLQGFTISASDNGGPFAPWLSNTTAAAATYTGAVGHTYSFYSIATDLTGNMEAAKALAEASTAVTDASSCGPPSLSGQVLSSSGSGTTVTVNLQLTNTGFTAAQAVNVNKMTFRTLSGSGAVTLANPVLPAAEGPVGIGASTTLTLTLNVPTTVTRFSLTEGGNLQDGIGNTYNYSMGQTVIP